MISFKENELKELLIKSWMTHDGMWFYHCLKECGIEKTNKINKAASKSLGTIEIKRFKKAFNIDSIRRRVKVGNERIPGPFYMFRGDLTENGEGRLYVHQTPNQHLQRYEKYLAMEVA